MVKIPIHVHESSINKLLIMKDYELFKKTLTTIMDVL